MKEELCSELRPGRCDHPWHSLCFNCFRKGLSGQRGLLIPGTDFLPSGQSGGKRLFLVALHVP